MSLVLNLRHRTRRSVAAWLALCTVPFLAVETSQAQVSQPISRILFDTSGSGGDNYFPATYEYGDEAVLIEHPPSGLWVMTEFLFEYFGDFTPQGDERGRIRIYLNDGSVFQNYPPNTVLYDSEEFVLEAGFQTKAFQGLAITIPKDIADKRYPHVTWTMQFSGLRGVEGDRAGLILRGDAEVGHNFNDYWAKRPNGWVLEQILPPNPNLPPDPVTNPKPKSNFAARIYGLPQGGGPAPRLNIRQEAANLVLQWDGGARLQMAEFAGGPFRDVSNATSPHTVAVADWDGAARFWRLVSGVVQPPGLRMQRSVNGFSLEWDAGARLQVAEKAEGPFTDVPGASSPFNVEVGNGAAPLKFWRAAR